MIVPIKANESFYLTNGMNLTLRLSESYKMANEKAVAQVSPSSLENCFRKAKKALSVNKRAFSTSDLGEARTLDPLIKSQLLYQLSYQVVLWLQRNDFSTSFATTFINYLRIHLFALLFYNVTADILIVSH